MSIGGNDARVYQQGGGTLAERRTAGTAAGGRHRRSAQPPGGPGQSDDQLPCAERAVAPEVATNPTAQAIRERLLDGLLQCLQPVLAGYAANGSIVHYLDGTVLAHQVSANPSAYGFTNGLVCPIFPNTTCVVNSNGYLFYGDALHLTSQGFALVAQYVARQLAAPLTLQAPSDLGLDVAQQWGRTLSSRSDPTGVRRSGGPAGLCRGRPAPARHRRDEHQQRL